MAESKSDRICLNGCTWIASRPAALPFLIDAGDYVWGQSFTFHGTEAELIGAGVAEAPMFQGMGKSGQRTRSTGFGDRYTVKRRRDKWDLEYRLGSHGRDGAPSDAEPRPCDWWRKHGGEAAAATSAILLALKRKT